ncbi:MAG: hypothetical protein GDA42_04200 [Ekhidna sp.]|nr:hypothetical protein [Ekhidna sp.]
MNDVIVAIIVSSILTILLALIQISADSKSPDIRGTLTLSFAFYILVMMIGNIITTLLSVSIVDNYMTKKDDTNEINQLFLIGPIWIWYSFFGVFGFEAIIQKINITFFNQGVLSINDWLTKAKRAATAATLEKVVELSFEHTQKLAKQLAETKDTSDIHTFALVKLGDDKYNEVMSLINGNPNIDVDQYLSYLLSEQFPKEVRAEVKAE